MARRTDDSRSRINLLPALVATLALSGCHLAKGTMATVPREWRDVNSWGPQGIAARDQGTLRPVFYTAKMAADAQSARENLEDGDILFRYHTNCKPADRLVAWVLMGASDTKFSHTGVIFHRGGDVWVYDAVPNPEGVRKVPYEFWALDTAPDTLAVMRLKPEHRGCIPLALAYCEAVWLRQPRYDTKLRLDDEEFYCTELVEKAYRYAGIVLSEPITMPCLPYYTRFQWVSPLAEGLVGIRPDEPAFSLGNPCYGTYGSPYLELVFGGEDRKGHRPPAGPRCPPTPFPAEAVQMPAPPASGMTDCSGTGTLEPGK